MTLRLGDTASDFTAGLRFYDANGREVKEPFGNRVIGIDLERLSRIRTTIGIAGGKRKFAAIVACLRGKWINTLVTDQYTADRLAKHSAKEQRFASSSKVA